MPISQRKAGVILSYTETLCNGLIGIIYVPLLLHFLTKQEYGIYQLMGSVIVYLAIMDFGLANTITRYYARAIEEKDENKKRQIISTGIWFYGIIALVIALLGCGAYFLIDLIYKGSFNAVELSLAKEIYWIMLFNIAVSIPSHIFSALMMSHEKFVFLRGANIVKILLQPLVIFAALSLNPNLILLVLVQTAMNLLVISFNFLFCRHKLKIKFALDSFDKDFTKAVGKFSLFVFINSLMFQVFWRGGYLILGAVGGAASVAVYSVATQISLFYVFLPLSISSVFLPRLSAIVAKTSDMTEINQIFTKLGRLQFLLTALILGGFILVGQDFIRLWVGDGFSAAYTASILLMFGFSLDTVQNIGNALLQAQNKHAFRAYVNLVLASFNLILAIPLSKYYGITGCAFSTMFCLVLSSICLNWYYVKTGVDIKGFFISIRRLFAVSVLAFALGWVFGRALPDLGGGILIPFLLKGGAYTGIFVLLTWFFGFNDYEKGLVTKPLSAAISFLRHRKNAS